MMRKVWLVTLVPLAIAGCDKPAPTNQPNVDATTGVAIPADGKPAHGTGVIKAIDAATGTVTLEHGPVTELQWPAMTMGFSGTPTMMKKLSVGDKVDFAFSWNGKVGRLAMIAKR